MQSFDFLYVFKVIPRLIPGLGITLWVAFLTFFLGLLFGALLAWAKLGRNKILKSLAYGYTSVIRCTPSIIILFLCYYGLPKVLSNFGININNFPQIYFVLIALILQYAAVLSELIRSTYEAIDRGQFEAAAVAGLTNWQALRRIIIPQGIYIAIPNLGNTVIGLLKEGSLAFTIGLLDLMGKGMVIISLNYGVYALETYLAMSLIYWALTLGVARGSRQLEKIVHDRTIYIQPLPVKEKLNGA